MDERCFYIPRISRCLCGISIFIAFFLCTGTAFAEDQAVSKQLKCQDIQDKVQNNISNINKVRVKHRNDFTNLRSRLSEFAGRLEKSGYDTAKINEDLDKLNAMINDFNKNFAAYNIAALSAKKSSCTNIGEFKSKILESRIKVKAVRESSVQIKKFYQNDIKEDLKNLRKKK